MRKTAALVMYAMIFALVSSSVYSALGATHPADLQLRPGGSDRFKFEIQAVSHPSDVECSYHLDNNPLFDLIFDDGGPVTIEAGGVALVTGTVTVGELASPGMYTRNIEVSCMEVVDSVGGGGSAAVGVYNIFINVNVVGERTLENIYVPPAPEETLIPASAAAALIALIALVIVVLAVLLRRRKKSM